MNSFDLSNFFTTKSEASNFLAHISSISDNIYEVDFNLEKQLQKHFGLQKKDKFLSLLRDNNVEIDSKPQLKDFLENIQKATSQLSSVSITLALEPDENILKAISDWFILNLKKQILINIQVNPEIIAGAIINYEGKHLNNTVLSVFEQPLSPKPNIQNKPENVTIQSS